MNFFKNITDSLAVASKKYASSGTAFAALLTSALCCPGIANAMPAPVSGTHHDSGMYASIQYNGNFFTNMGDFEIKETASGVTTKSILGYNKDGKLGTYDPQYYTDYISGGIAVGYSMGGPRIEIEATYANFDIDDEDYKDKNNAMLVEAVRGNDITGSYTGKAPAFGKNLSSEPISITEYYNAAIDGGETSILVSTLPDAGADYVTINKANLAFKTVNDGIRSFGGFVNVAYDLHTANMPVVPFVLAGVGFAQNKFMEIEKYGLAFQGKVGLTYTFNENFGIFGGYQYVGMGFDEFKEVKPTVTIAALSAGAEPTPAPGTPLPGTTPPAATPQMAPATAIVASSDATVTTRLGYHGPFLGVKIQF